jgi:hypothetical protein
MDRNSFDETIPTFKRRTPFRPFTVSLVNGDRVEVDHPEALVVRDGVALFVGPGGIPAVFEHEGVAQVIGDLVRPASPE